MADVLKKVPVREQDPKVRATNFEEVCYGYNKEEAMMEAQRCFGCKNAKCIEGCPVSIDIPAFIGRVKVGEIEEAYKILSRYTSLPATCGRVCPQENQCEGKCIRGIKGEAVSIGKLERFVADAAAKFHYRQQDPAPANGHKIAIVGSGPAGLACAGELARMGCDVTIFEALHEPGGVLRYGIPEFRLPKKRIVAREIDNVTDLGVKIETNVVIGKSITIDELMDEEGFQAVFIGSGAGLPKFMGIPGENANGVFSANEYLTRSNLMKAFDENSNTPIMGGKKVAVVGGGNVAMDAARVAKRNGAEEVYILYRKGFENMPCTRAELEEAKEDDVNFELFKAPIELTEQGVKYIETKNEVSEDGKVSTITIEGTEGMFECDSVIIAVSQSPRKNIVANTTGLDTNKWGLLLTDDKGHTTRNGVFASGDVVTGANTVVHAVSYAKIVAESIEEYCNNNK